MSPELTVAARPATSIGRGFRRFLGVFLMVGSVIGATYELVPIFTFRSTSAIVITVAMRHVSDSNLRGGLHSSGRSFGRNGSLPDVMYRYSVGGDDYLGWHYARTNMVESSRVVAKRLRSYRPGSTVTAWYDPAHPDDAVLSRTPNPVLLMILAVLAIAGAFVWSGARAGATISGAPPE